MLAADACVSPRGDLVVAVHSGLPDWGSGPKGKGKLYKIEYRDREAPQPVLAWAPGPQEARIAFDRPLDPDRSDATSLDPSPIEYGASVRPATGSSRCGPATRSSAGSWLRPGSSCRSSRPRSRPTVATLLLTTAPHPEASSYAIILPGLASPNSPKARPRDLPQVAAVDLGYDLCGVNGNLAPRGNR